MQGAASNTVDSLATHTPEIKYGFRESLGFSSLSSSLLPEFLAEYISTVNLNEQFFTMVKAAEGSNPTAIRRQVLKKYGFRCL